MDPTHEAPAHAPRPMPTEARADGVVDGLASRLGWGPVGEPAHPPAEPPPAASWLPGQFEDERAPLDGAGLVAGAVGMFGGEYVGELAGGLQGDLGCQVSPSTMGALVQAKSSSGMAGDASGIQAAAARGVQGDGESLPFIEEIQASFGPHDVRGARGHIGGAAAEAAEAMGAEAFATGNDAAFAKAPDLFTAAHEAAHIVQQREGVQLLGGVGQAGDTYEQNADRVAGAVVRGESAAPLLGAVNSPGTQRGVVQRKEADSDEDEDSKKKPNSRLHVYAYDKRHRVIKKYVKDAFHLDVGALPFDLIGSGPPPIKWSSRYKKAAAGVRIGANRHGKGGATLDMWAPKKTHKIIVQFTELGGATDAEVTPSGPVGDPEPDVETGPIPGVGEGKDGFEDGTGEGAKGEGTGGPRSDDEEACEELPFGSSECSNEESTEGGSFSGKKGGGQDGSGDTYGGTITGKKGGDDEGAKGGDGKDGDAGARGAMALFGGMLNIPRAIRPLVEVALILEDGGAFGFGGNFIKNRLKRFASGGGAKKAAATEARRYAAKKAKEILKDHVKSPAWKKLTKEEQKSATRIITWQLQRRYMDGAEQAAKEEIKKLTKAIKNSPDGAMKDSFEKQKKLAEEFVQESKVKLVAGRKPINSEYAGKEFPKESLPPQYQKKGVKFTEAGYPEFDPHAMVLPNKKTSVQIELTGSRRLDEAAANKAAKLKRTPEGYIWHHHEDMGKMLLVPKPLHEAVKHTGGAAGYKHVKGLAKYGS